MAAMLDKMTTYDCKVIRTPSTITVIKLQGIMTYVINVTRLDMIEMNDDEQSVIYPLLEAGEHGVPFVYELSQAEMQSLASVRDKIEKTFTVESPPIVPEVKAALSEIKSPVKMVTNQTASTPVVNGTPLTSLNGYTVDIVAQAKAQAAKDVADILCPVKTRKKRGEKYGQFIHDEYRKRTRGHGLDDMEKRITHLQAVAVKASKDIMFLDYDIPSVIRAKIVDPCRLLWCFGFRHTESMWIIPKDSIEADCLQSLFALFERFSDPTSQVYRDAMGLKDGDPLPLVEGKVPVITYSYDEFSAKSLDTIKKKAHKALENVLRETHTRLIQNIDRADKELAEAMNEETITQKGMQEAECDRANTLRKELTEASEILARSVASAVEYDDTEALMPLLSGLRDAIKAHAIAFNAKQRARREKGCDL